MDFRNLDIPEEEDVNMTNAFSTPDVQIDIPGSIEKGLSNANALRYNSMLKMRQEEAQRQLDTQNRTRGYLKNAMVPGADANLQKINISVSRDGENLMTLEGYKLDR